MDLNTLFIRNQFISTEARCSNKCILSYQKASLDKNLNPKIFPLFMLNPIKAELNDHVSLFKTVFDKSSKKEYPTAEKAA